MNECIPEFNAWLRIFGHISGYGDLCHRWAWVGGGDCWPVTSMASRGSFLGAPDKWPAPCKGWYLLTWRLICVVSQNLLRVVFRDSTPCNIYLLYNSFFPRFPSIFFCLFFLSRFFNSARSYQQSGFQLQPWSMVRFLAFDPKVFVSFANGWKRRTFWTLRGETTKTTGGFKLFSIFDPGEMIQFD